MTDWLNNIQCLKNPDPVIDDIELQVGIYGNENSSIKFKTELKYDLSYILEEGVEGKNACDTINVFLNKISERTTEFGAISNRLESALDSVNTDIINLTSSLSTIKDADITKISGEYIRYQILQQASATLYATANQSPSIALQLI